MRPDLESTLNLKKARIKENDTRIEHLNEVIANLGIRKEKETNLRARKIVEREIATKIEMRDSLVEQNKIAAQIVLDLMR